MGIDGPLLERRRVLVAEDQFVLALDLTETLRGWGCGVIGPAASNAEALRLLERARPDAALLDATLADGWAVPVAEALAAAGVPFALLTGHDSADLPQPALCGVPWVGKPYVATELRQTLDRLLALDGHGPLAPVAARNSSDAVR